MRRRAGWSVKVSPGAGGMSDVVLMDLMGPLSYATIYKAWWATGLLDWRAP